MMLSIRRMSFLLPCSGLWPLLYVKNPASCLSSKYSSVIRSYPLALFAGKVRKFKVKHLVIHMTSRTSNWAGRVNMCPSPLNTMYKNRSGDEGAKQDWRGAKDDVDPSLTLCHPIYICDHMSGEQIRFATHAQDKSAVPNMSGFLTGCNGCGSCTEMAIAGVLSVYQNTYWHSEQETVHESCFSALYPSSTSFQEEAFRNYSKCEIILIALEYLSLFPEELCVLRIAGNHHFYWPIIHFLGSIYNACWSHWGRSLPKVSICPILLIYLPFLLWSR